MKSWLQNKSGKHPLEKFVTPAFEDSSSVKQLRAPDGHTTGACMAVQSASVAASHLEQVSEAGPEK